MSDKNRCSCLIFFCWLFQFSVWINLIWPITLPYNAEIILYCTFSLIIYIVYLILEFCAFCTHHGYCSEKYINTYAEVNEVIERILSTPPKIKWNITCYHYEIQNRTRYIKEGEIERLKINKRIVTYSASKNMSFYYSRDISGPLKINYRDIGINKYGNIDLSITQDRDNLTQKDYERQKNEFINAHKNKDQLYEITEKRKISGVKNLYKLNINKDRPSCCVFAFLTFITLGELYNCSIGYYSRNSNHFNNGRVDYKIIKTISSKENLNSTEYNNFYKQLDPKIDLGFQQYNYSSSKFTYLNPDYRRNLPYKEDNENDDIKSGDLPPAVISNREDRSSEKLNSVKKFTSLTIKKQTNINIPKKN